MSDDLSGTPEDFLHLTQGLGDRWRCDEGALRNMLQALRSRLPAELAWRDAALRALEREEEALRLRGAHVEASGDWEGGWLCGEVFGKTPARAAQEAFKASPQAGVGAAPAHDATNALLGDLRAALARSLERGRGLHERLRCAEEDHERAVLQLREEGAFFCSPGPSSTPPYFLAGGE
ncbi:unnamed protein product [Prorocentrum cordatum]|uniref:Uncharacterized protein n=1 Tax=Prorocentrum cordatum TaxID=2364126 RepID=A0ABN9R3F4_9DINO|nr:unnamed protein product [Polarella glacialis]